MVLVVVVCKRALRTGYKVVCMYAQNSIVFFYYTSTTLENHSRSRRLRRIVKATGRIQSYIGT